MICKYIADPICMGYEFLVESPKVRDLDIPHASRNRYKWLFRALKSLFENALRFIRFRTDLGLLYENQMAELLLINKIKTPAQKGLNSDVIICSAWASIWSQMK